MSKAKMKESTSLQLEAPRFLNGKALVLAGLRSRYASETMNGIPAQWERFAPHIGKLPGPVGHAAYGACWNLPGGIDYLTGVEVSRSSGIPGEFIVVGLPEQKYAVFPHREHVSRLRETLDAIGTYGFRNLVMSSLVEPLVRPTSSSVTPRNSIPGPVGPV